MLTTVEHVLNDKGHDVWSLSPDATVLDALELMTARRVEACPVVETGRLVGMLTERDCARRVMLPGRHPRDVRVGDVMTSPVVFVSSGHTVADCMKVLAERGFAHLPVVDGSAVVGIVSMGDLVNRVVKDQGATIRHLEAYITDTYPN